MVYEFNFHWLQDSGFDERLKWAGLFPFYIVIFIYTI